MKHIRWMISMGLLGVSTHVARELHGWNGFWLVMVVMIVFGLVNFFDGYFARQQELEEKLNRLASHRPPFKSNEHLG